MIKCKICRLEFDVKSPEDVPESTKAEHIKHVGHNLEF